VLDDPTVQKCWHWARDWKFNSFLMLNVYAYRTSDPKHLWETDNPVGSYNDTYLKAYARASQCVIAAWGRRGTQRERQRCGEAQELLASETDLYCLVPDDDPWPRHPRPLSNGTKRRLWLPRD
jgi:hypothetical protein